MTSYILTNDQQQCYGCSACVEICPRKALTLLPNNEGFLYPVIDPDLCIKCGLCHNVCPYDNESCVTTPLNVHAVQNIHIDDLSTSSSGGVFIAFAKAFLDMGGQVAGCIFNDKFEAIHVLTEDIDVVHKMQGSKYVQSNLNNIFPSVKAALNKGIPVLFSGTPCQVDGLKRYLIKDYDILFTIDLICHGVPSPRLLSEFTFFFSSKHGKILDLKFRNKKKYGWGSQGTIKCVKQERVKEYKITPFNNSYYNFFYIKNMVSRYSCYSCKYSSINRVADLTIGDCWNIQELYPDINFDKGASVVLVNSLKGYKYFTQLKDSFKFFNISLDDVVKGNQNLCKPSSLPAERELIYDQILNRGYDKVASEKFHKQAFIPCIKDHTPFVVKRLLKKLLRNLKS